MNEKEQLTDTAVIVMARYPMLGATKTRLARTLGDEKTVRLYRAFLTDLAHHHGKQAYTLCWAYTPANVDYRALIESLAPEQAQGMRYFPQQGEGLGERLLSAFHQVSDQGYRCMMVIGSDSPHIQPATIAQARAALDDSDVVLGPADDGGYYLLGMERPYDVFSGIPMSTPDVLTMTIEAAQHQELSVRVIESLFDVDEMPDLLRLATLLTYNRTLAPATAAYLEQIRMIP